MRVLSKIETYSGKTFDLPLWVRSLVSRLEWGSAELGGFEGRSVDTRGEVRLEDQGMVILVGDEATKELVDRGRRHLKRPVQVGGLITVQVGSPLEHGYPSITLNGKLLPFMATFASRKGPPAARPVGSPPLAAFI